MAVSDENEVRSQLEPLVGVLEQDELAHLVAEVRLVVIPGSQPPWVDTGLTLVEGESFSVLSAGELVVSSELGLSFGPRLYLWRRIGEDGDVFRGARETATHRATRAGRLYLGIYPGSWTTRAGDFEAGPAVPGALAAVLVRWRGAPIEALRAVERAAPGQTLIRSEIARLESPVARPKGWTPLWFLGETDVFSALDVDGKRAIRARPETDVGIIKHPVATELGPDTRLRWSWRYDELPSRVAENQFHTHDYISIAVEFENGQDLTWYWSAELPAETHYRCPLPWWDQRETHLAIRSGADGLGAWHTEERNVYDDYRTAIGEPPARIVGVWLIAVSLFSKSRGSADFADIEIVQPTESVPVA